jgi:hypothetical protein
MLMVGTAMPSGHSHTAGAAAGMVWQQLGVLQGPLEKKKKILRERKSKIYLL